ncbi:MAG: Gfo/Idh/MocA family oxidoreductase [Planctomycetota bacterium]
MSLNDLATPEHAPTTNTGPGDAAVSDPPQLTVVLVVGAEYRVVARTVAHWARQTIAERIELLLMAAHPETVTRDLPNDLPGRLHTVRVVPIGDERRVGRIRAEGIRQAAAPYVAMSEDHCFPAADVAERFAAQHAEGADVVGPGMDNANPATPVSWAAHLIAYEPWAGRGEAREMTFLAGHNASYRKAVATSVGDELNDLMSSEVVLHWRLAAEGKRIVFEPAARCRHVNQTGVPLLAKAMYEHSRNFGWLRARSLSPIKRWLYVVAGPMIAALRFKRSLRQTAEHLPDNVSRPRVLMALAPVYLASAAGEAAGLALGPGEAPMADWNVELDRSRFIEPADNTLIDPATPARDSDPPAPVARLDEPVRVGVIGCGGLTRDVHLPLLNRHPHAEIVALADLSDDARAQAARLAPQAETYADPSALLADPRVEAVIIATPTATHAGLAVEAFAAGKHVYLEKPIAADPADGQRVLDARQAAGTIGMVGFNYRCRPAYRAARELIGRGEIGRVTLLRSTFTRAAGQTDGWRRDTVGGGPLLDFASHEVDLAAFLLAEPLLDASASAWSAAFPDDSASLTASTPSGARVECFVSFSATDDARLEVIGQRGRITIDRYGALGLERAGVSAQGPAQRTLQQLAQWRRLPALLRRRQAPWFEPSFGLCIGRFLDAVRAGSPARPDLADGLASLRVIDDARRAAATPDSHATRPAPCATPAVPSPTTA